MPPKRNVNKTPTPVKTPKERAPRKREKKEKVEKPKLKTPTVVKLKLPSIKSFFNNAKTSKTSPMKANTGNKSPVISPAVKRKIELANEVAQSQLGKPILDVKPVEEPPAKKTTPNVRSTRRRRFPAKNEKGQEKDEILSSPPSARTPTPASAPAPTPAPSPSPKKPNTVAARKCPATRAKKKSDTEDKTATNKRKADSTSNKIAQRKSPRYSTGNTQQNNIIEVPPSKRRLNKTKMNQKGKPEVQEDTTDCEHTPSMLDGNNLNKDDIPTTDALNENDLSEPVLIASRKTSTSECLSWTKDISSSSTTTTCLTVGSNDFFRIDKKLPVVKLSNIDNQCGDKNSELSDSSESSDSDSSSSSSNSSSSLLSLGRSPSLNLSTSSDKNSLYEHKEEDDQWKQALDKLSSNLKMVDLKVIDWIGYEDQDIGAEFNEIQQKLLKVLIHENDVIELCKNLQKQLQADNIESNNVEGNKEKVIDDVDLVNTDKSDDENFTSSRSKYVMFDQNCVDEENPLEIQKVFSENSEEDNFTSDKVTYMSFENNYDNDDDDALSLFAESITGIESSRYTSANSLCAEASDFEEYIPEPKSRQKLPVTATYIPTRITTDDMQVRKSVCEKQNADSTSVVRGNENPSQTEQPKNMIHYNRNTSSPVVPFRENVPPSVTKKRPILLSTMHRSIYGVKSVVFRGVCFYNLISNCKKSHCAYPHQSLELAELKNILSKLTDETFIQEYMIMRNWPSIRRQFGMQYADECIKRRLTRVLVEMTIDCILKAKLDSVEDKSLTISITERTLVYLNDVDLNTCVDLLQYEFKQDVLLCDMYMQTIAETQNFSRFKVVFIKLTNFITGLKRSFQLDVANHILERVCILPCEEQLVKAMLKIIIHTDPKIFGNSMMSKFESQVVAIDYNLLEILKRAKELWIEPVQTVAACPRQSWKEMEQTNIMFTDKERYTSPDTTKLDNSTKTIEQQIPHTVEIIRPSIFSQLFKNNTPRPDRPVPFMNFRGHNFQRHINMNPRFPRPPHMMRPPLKRRGSTRQVSFGLPPKFPRRGPDFF